MFGLDGSFADGELPQGGEFAFGDGSVLAERKRGGGKDQKCGEMGFQLVANLVFPGFSMQAPVVLPPAAASLDLVFPGFSMQAPEGDCGIVIGGQA